MSSDNEYVDTWVCHTVLNLVVQGVSYRISSIPVHGMPVGGFVHTDTWYAEMALVPGVLTWQ